MIKDEIRPRKQESNQITIFAICFMLLAIFFSCASCYSGGDKDKSSKTGTGGKGDEASAFVWCQGYVRNQLKSPGSAKFPFADFSYGKINDTSWRIKSYVDSENSFGAMLRTNWTCDIQYIGGNWKLLDLALSAR